MSGTGLDEVVLVILAVLILIIFLGSLYAFFYSIFLFIFSNGRDEQLTKAKNTLRYMLLGILLTIGVLWFFPVILNRAGLTDANKFTAQSIFDKSIDIVEYLFSFGKEGLETYQEGKNNSDRINPNNGSNTGGNPGSLSPEPAPGEQYEL